MLSMTGPSLQPLVLADLLTQAQDPGCPWAPFRAGVDILRISGTPDGASAALLRYAPGAVVPRHTHTGYEHIYILAGTQVDAHGTYTAGTLIVNPPGSSHDIRSPDGCIVLGIWERPVSFH